MLDIDVKLESLLDALAKDGHNVAAAVESGLDRAAKVVLQQVKREAAKTYARPLPKTKSGKPKWSRTGAFQSDDVILKDPGTRTVTSFGASEAYEERLAALPAGPDGVKRANPKKENAYDKTEPQIAVLIEAEILNSLGF